MFILFAILIVLFLAGTFLTIKDIDLVGIPIFILLIIGVIAFLDIKWQLSSQTLTGYVYQRKELFGYATYDLRFSQNAGTDNQPSFCAKSGSEVDNHLQTIVGDSTAKVTLNIPLHSPFIANNPFQCASEPIIKSIQVEK